MGLKKIKFRNLSFFVSSLFAFTFVFPVFYLNKPLLWDDWVWFYNSNEQLRDVAIQLGYWWFAELNVFIYSLENPNLFLFSIAAFSHLFSVAILSKIFIRLKILDDFQCGIWIACCILSPFLLIRYINSLAFYNFYFAFFVSASYLFIFFKSYFVRLFSCVLFMVSFCLNSLIPAYFVIVFFSDREFFRRFLYSIKSLSLYSASDFEAVFILARGRFQKIGLYFSLPFFFYAIKLISPYQNIQSNPYESYNLPQFDNLLWTPLVSIKTTLYLIVEIIWRAFNVTGIYLLLGLVTVILVFFILFLVRRYCDLNFFDSKFSNFGRVSSRKKILLFVFSSIMVFPYILVGKPPILTDFTEARHFISVEPFIFAIAILLISDVSVFIGNFFHHERHFRSALLITFASFYAWSTVFKASAIWWEDKVSNQIIETVKRNKSEIKFWVFENYVPQFINSKRLNYVYTGYLVSAFGTYDNFGISKSEYLSWDRPVKLLSDGYYRKRYNMENYQHKSSFNYVVAKLQMDVTYNNIILMYLAETFGLKKFDMNKIIFVNVFTEFGCVDETVSFFSTGKLIEEVNSVAKNSYCKIKIKKYCDSIMSESQVVSLSEMEKAFTLQKYPSLLTENGLSIVNVNTDYVQISNQCLLIR